MYKVYYITWKGAHDVFWLCANSQEEAALIASTIQGVEEIVEIIKEEN